MNALNPMNALMNEAIDRRSMLALAGVLGGSLMLAGCDARGNGDASQNDADAGSSAGSASADAPTDAPAATTGAGRALVAVFSWSGNTLQLAESIQAATGADLVRIEPQEPYSTDYNTVIDVAQTERNDDVRRAMTDASNVANIADYDTIYLGYPVWWYRVPQIIKTWLDAHELAGKTIAPFCTSGGSTIGQTLDDIRALEPEATLTEGLTVNENNLDACDSLAVEWLASIGA